MSTVEITQEIEGEICITAVSGDIDTTTSPQLQKALSSEVEKGIKNHIIDLSNSRYISSMGLRVFLSHLKTINKLNGRLVICGCNELIEEIFEMSGFLRYFSMASDRREAIEMAKA